MSYVACNSASALAVLEFYLIVPYIPFVAVGNKTGLVQLLKLLKNSSLDFTYVFKDA